MEILDPEIGLLYAFSLTFNSYNCYMHLIIYIEVVLISFVFQIILYMSKLC